MTTSAGLTISQQVTTSTGLCSDQTNELFFGLGEADPGQLLVRYQDGSTFEAMPAAGATIQVP